MPQQKDKRVQRSLVSLQELSRPGNLTKLFETLMGRPATPQEQADRARQEQKLEAPKV